MTNRIQVTTIMRRNSEHSRFYKMSDELSSHVSKNYIKTGKILSRNVYTSSDKLSKTAVTHYASRRAWNEFRKDPLQQESFKNREQHIIEQNITLVICIQEYNLEDGVISTQIIRMNENENAQSLRAPVTD